MPSLWNRQATRVRAVYFHSLLIDMFCSESFFITLDTAISKSSCVTWIRRSRRANIPASVHTALHSAPDELGIFSAIALRLMPRSRFILREWMRMISIRDRLRWVWELDLSVNTTRTKQRRIQNVDTVRGHDHLDVLCWLETIELVEQLQHRSLDFRVTTAAFHTRATDGIDFIHENDRRRGLSRHDEELTDHPRTFTNVLLHQFGTRHTDERTVGVVRHGTSQERLTRTRRAVEQHTLWLGDTEGLEELWVLDWQLNHFLDLTDLLVETTDHVVRRVGHLLHLHQAHERIHLGREDLMKHVAVVTQRHTRVGRALGDVNGLVHIDDVLALRVHLDEHFGLAHLLDHLADIRAWFLKQLQLFTQQTHFRVEFITLRLQTTQVLGLLTHRQLQVLDLLVVVARDPIGRALGVARSRGRRHLLRVRSSSPSSRAIQKFTLRPTIPTPNRF